MKFRTRWKKVKNVSIIGERFFDVGEYTLGYFTVKAAYKCKEFCKGATAPNGTHWFDKSMIIIKTDSGIEYKVPFVPWAKVYSAVGRKEFYEFYNENPW